MRLIDYWAAESALESIAASTFKGCDDGKLIVTLDGMCSPHASHRSIDIHLGSGTWTRRIWTHLWNTRFRIAVACGDPAALAEPPKLPEEATFGIENPGLWAQRHQRAVATCSEWANLMTHLRPQEIRDRLPKITAERPLDHGQGAYWHPVFVPVPGRLLAPLPREFNLRRMSEEDLIVVAIGRRVVVGWSDDKRVPVFAEPEPLPPEEQDDTPRSTWRETLQEVIDVEADA